MADYKQKNLKISDDCGDFLRFYVYRKNTSEGDAVEKALARAIAFESLEALRLANHSDNVDNENENEPLIDARFMVKLLNESDSDYWRIFDQYGHWELQRASGSDSLKEREWETWPWRYASYDTAEEIDRLGRESLGDPGMA